MCEIPRIFLPLIQVGTSYKINCFIQLRNVFVLNGTTRV